MKHLKSPPFDRNTNAILLISLSLSSCTTMYIPNAQHVPILNGKHDAQVSLSVNNYQLAYAPTSHLGVMLNGYYRDTRYLSTYSKTGDSHNYHGVAKGLEGAIGYFSSKKYSTVGFFGGWGQGFCSISLSRDFVGGINLESNYNKAFIQSFFTYGNHIIKGSLSARISYLDFHGFNYNVSRSNQTPPPPETQLFFIEPATAIRVKFGWVSFQSQLQFSSPTRHANVTGNGYASFQQMLVVNAGFIFHVTELIQKRRNKS